MQFSPPPQIVPLPDEIPPDLQRPEDVEINPRGHFLTLRRTVEDELENHRVDITIEGFEIETNQTLLEWAKLRVQMNERYVRDIVPIEETEESIPTPEGSEQFLHAKLLLDDERIQPQVIWFTYGHLVYVINAYTHSKEMGEHLREIASTISIESDAPQTLQELYGTTEVIRSLEERLEEKHHFDRLPESDEDECDIVCRDRKQIQSMLTAQPDLSEDAFESESDASNEAGKISIEEAPILISPLQTPEPLQEFQARSAYNPEWLYTIQYDGQVWQVEEGKYEQFFLLHTTIPCKIILTHGGMDASKLSTKQLGAYTWTLFSDVPLLRTFYVYEQEIGQQYYIIAVDYAAGDPNFTPSSADREQCQKLTENILTTFTPLP